MNTFMQLSLLPRKRKGCKCFDCQHETSIIHLKLTVFISDMILGSHNPSIKDRVIVSAQQSQENKEIKERKVQGTL